MADRRWGRPRGRWCVRTEKLDEDEGKVEMNVLGRGFQLLVAESGVCGGNDGSGIAQGGMGIGDGGNSVAGGGDGEAGSGGKISGD